MTPSEYSVTDPGAEEQQPSQNTNAVPDPNINNLDQFNDVEEIDPNASITDAPPPPVVGTYQIRLKLLQNAVKDEKKIIRPERFPAKNVSSFVSRGKSYLMITIEQEIVSPDGRKYQTQQDWASTMVLESVKTSAVDTYLRIITGRAGIGMTQMQKVEMLYDLLATEPVVNADIDWLGQVPAVNPDGTPKLRANGKQEYVTGKLNGRFLSRMVNFPFVEVNGEKHYKPAETDDNGTEVSTRWQVTKLFPMQG